MHGNLSVSFRNKLFSQRHSTVREIYTPHMNVLSEPENQGILFLYISQTFQMNRISFMVTQVNAVLLIHWFCMRD